MGEKCHPQDAFQSFFKSIQTHDDRINLLELCCGWECENGVKLKRDHLCRTNATGKMLVDHMEVSMTQVRDTQMTHDESELKLTTLNSCILKFEELIKGIVVSEEHISDSIESLDNRLESLEHYEQLLDRSKPFSNTVLCSKVTSHASSNTHFDKILNFVKAKCLNHKNRHVENGASSICVRTQRTHARSLISRCKGRQNILPRVHLHRKVRSMEDTVPSPVHFDSQDVDVDKPGLQKNTFRSRRRNRRRRRGSVPAHFYFPETSSACMSVEDDNMWDITL